jgi:hypothetical protein
LISYPLLDYVAAIDPRSLEDACRLLGGVATQEDARVINPRDKLGMLIRQKYDAGIPLKDIATQINQEATWGKNWDKDRVNKELTRHCARKGIERPRRNSHKQKRSRQE